jgi:hypothetical protein
MSTDAQSTNLRHEQVEPHGEGVGRQDSNASPTSGSDSELQVVKLHLEISKLQEELKKAPLETKTLTRQLSLGAAVLEWVKAGSVFAALVGVAATLYLGQQQTKIAQQQAVNAQEAANNAREAAERQSADAEKNHAADRFDKALARLAEKDNIQARLSGVAGLKLFLTDGNSAHQKEALHYLITALSHKVSADVRQAIVDSLGDADRFSVEVKNDALETAIEANRGLTILLFQKLTGQDSDDVNQFFEKQGAKKPDSYDDYRAMPFVQKIMFSSIGARPIFHDPSGSNLTLDALV